MVHAVFSQAVCTEMPAKSVSLIVDGFQSLLKDFLSGYSERASSLSFHYYGSYIFPLMRSLKCCLCPLLSDNRCEGLLLFQCKHSGLYSLEKGPASG